MLLLICSPACWSRGNGGVHGGSGMRLLDIDLHAMVGGSYVSENYMDCFTEITDINTNMGVAYGLGLGAKFNLSRTVGLGTGINLVRNRGTIDIAVGGQQTQNISNVFQRNTYYAFDFPVYLSYSPSIATGLRWNFDLGLYYSYGIKGTQKNTVYDAKINELGQLMMTRTVLKTGFYSDGAFINGFRRADIGLHIATGITVLEHLKLGLRGHFGLKNVARTAGIKDPSCHNLSFMAVAGWVF